MENAWKMVNPMTSQLPLTSYSKNMHAKVSIINTRDILCINFWIRPVMHLANPVGSMAALLTRQHTSTAGITSSHVTQYRTSLLRIALCNASQKAPCCLDGVTLDRMDWYRKKTLPWYQSCSSPAPVLLQSRSILTLWRGFVSLLSCSPDLHIHGPAWYAS